MSVVNALWVERYRPQKISDCILPEKAKKVFQSFVDTNDMPNLMLAGPAGIGKTTVAKALCNELGYDVMVVNGSNEGRLIETFRTKVADFASSVSFTGSRKVVIIDEADYMNAESVQPALRNMIEEFHSNCGFIFTCNYPNRIIEPLHSRCTVVDFTIPTEEKQNIAVGMFKRVVSILEENGVKYEQKAVVELVKTYFPDFRRTLNELQRYSSTGTIDVGILSNASKDEMDKLIGFLKAKNFREMRVWVASTSTDIVSVCRRMYDTMYDNVKPEYIPQLILHMADYQFKDSFVADKEINMVAMLYTIMCDVEWK